MDAPGTWHDSNPNEPVDFAVAKAAWADAALPELEEVAKHLYGTITYQDLAEAVQTRTGYRTKMLLTNWTGKALDAVIERAQREGLPPLTSLVIHKTTGGVGPGYYNRAGASSRQAVERSGRRTDACCLLPGADTSPA